MDTRKERLLSASNVVPRPDRRGQSAAGEAKLNLSFPGVPTTVQHAPRPQKVTVAQAQPIFDFHG
jgi:hypothetical protein